MPSKRPAQKSVSHTKEWVRSLCAWYMKNARPLPWRKHRDPYIIWISEVMLQQTQVTTVLPYFERFLNRFPTLDRLARAPEPEVLSAWSGLGYYSRARNLRKGAQYLMEQHQAKIPLDREALLKVPGIGPYTAGAILSIAHDLAVPIVDGNIQRVFARFFGVDLPLESARCQRFFWEKAKETVELSQSPSTFNQALMELGATLCIKTKPLCDRCPVGQFCLANQEGRQNDLPLKKKKRDIVELYWKSFLFERNGKLFLVKNEKGQWWSDLWDFPRIEAKKTKELSVQFENSKKKWGLQTRIQSLAKHRHTVTHHRLHVFPIRIQLKSSFSPGPWKGRWEVPELIEELPISSLARKVLHSYRVSVASPEQERANHKIAD